MIADRTMSTTVDWLKLAGENYEELLGGSPHHTAGK
jgi:hypothetical protein